MKKMIFVSIISIFLLSGCVNDTDIGGISLKMEKTTFTKDETIKAWVETDKEILVGFNTFEVYQLSDNEWQYINDVCMGCYSMCSAGAEYICKDDPNVMCAPLPEECMDFEPEFDKFRWDQEICWMKEIDCGSGKEESCFYEEKAEPGTYKIVFRFAEECADEWLFESDENNIQTIEKEFEITDEQKELKYNVVELIGIECWGCGFDLVLVGKVFPDKTKEEPEEHISIINTKWDSKCLEAYEEKTEEREEEIKPLEIAVYYDYLLTKGEIEDIKACIRELEDSGYCEDTVDCCEGYFDEEECDKECVEDKCIGK